MRESSEAVIVKKRVCNATRIAVSDPDVATIGTQGAIAYALLDLANAIRETGPDEKTKRLLNLADLMVDAVVEGATEKQVKNLADEFFIERRGYEIDQKNGLERLKGME